MRIFTFFLVIFSLVSGLTKLAYADAKVAIIIDDIGYRYTDKDAVNLPGQLSFAVLPHTPHGKKLAKQAHADNKEVIIHMPMQSARGRTLGPGALTYKMSESAFREKLDRAFEEIPFAIGMNNHMGSYLTSLYQPMAWTMRYLKERDLFFIDSLTTPLSKASRIANHFGVPSRKRHVFLDNVQDEEYISKQFDQLIRDAKRFKSVVAIGHPYPATVRALNKLLPTLKDHNIELVPVSQLLPNNQSGTLLAKKSPKRTIKLKNNTE